MDGEEAQPGTEVQVPAGEVVLEGFLGRPTRAKGAVLFAHGSGSGRFSPRNGYVAHELQSAGLATLLIDLLTPEESADRRLVFDIPLLASRLLAATDWLDAQPATRDLGLGYFGASTGAGAALVAAAQAPAVRAVVSRGGRPDLAGEALSRVRAATLLIVGGNDPQVLELNQQAYQQLPQPKELVVVPGAGHLFAESGRLEEVASLAGGWFLMHLSARS